MAAMAPLQSQPMRIRLLVLFTLVALPALAARADDKHSWELQSQYWGELPNAASQPAATPQEEPMLDEAERLIVQRPSRQAKHVAARSGK